MFLLISNKYVLWYYEIKYIKLNNMIKINFMDSINKRKTSKIFKNNGKIEL